MDNKNILSSFLFFLFLGISSLSYYFRESAYIRPSFYFYLLACMSGIVFYQILTLKGNQKFEKLLVLLEIFLIPISFTLTQQTLYKTTLGIDPWEHGVLISQILKTHNIPPYQSIGTPYVWVPNFHLIISSSILISDITYKWASFISIGVSTLILEMLIIYKVGKLIFANDKITLAAVLFLAISDNVLDMIGKDIIPNTIGIAITFVIFYIFLKGGINTKSNGVVMCLLIFSLSLLHTISFAFMMIQTMLIFIILSLSITNNVKRMKTIGYTIMLMWTIAILSWGIISSDFYLHRFIVLIKRLIPAESTGIHMYSSSIPFKFVFLGRLGMITYFGISGICILYYLYTKLLKKQLTERQLILSINSAFFISFGVFAVLVWPEIAHRFWYYGEILGSFFVAYIILAINRKNRNAKTLLITCLVIGLFAWLMFTASISNDDNPLVKEYTLRTGLFDSEKVSMDFILDRTPINTTIASDYYAIDDIINIWSTENSTKRSVQYPQTFEEVTADSIHIFLFRKDLIKTRYFQLGDKWSRKIYQPLGDKSDKIIFDLSMTEKVRLYDNNNVIIFGD